ncbi:MAG: fibronectin type III domain-containing protein, partial [Nitrospirota bacterium]
TLTPSAPGNPLAVAADNQVTVSWGSVTTNVNPPGGPAAGLAGYRLYRSTDPTMAGEVLIANEFALPISETVGGGTSHTTQYVDNDANTLVGGGGPNNCQIYYYTVTVVDRCNTPSARSTVQSVKPDSTVSPGVTPPDNGKKPPTPTLTYLEAGDDTSVAILKWSVPAPSSSESIPVGVRIYYRVQGASGWTLSTDIPTPSLPATGEYIINGLASNTNYDVKVASYDDLGTGCGDETPSATGEVFTGACAPSLLPVKNANHLIYPGTTASGSPVPTDGTAVVGLLSATATRFITWVADPTDCTPDSSIFGDQGFDYKNPPAYGSVAYNNVVVPPTSAQVQFYINDPGPPAVSYTADARYGTAASGLNPGNVPFPNNSANIDYAPRYADGYYHFPNYLDSTHLDTSKFCDASYDFKVVAVDGEQYTAEATTRLAIKNGGIEVDTAKTVTSDITTVDDFHHIVRFGIKNSNSVLDLKLNKITLTWSNANAYLEKLEVLKVDKTTGLGNWEWTDITPSTRAGSGTEITLKSVLPLMKADTSNTDDEGYIRLTFKDSPAGIGPVTIFADMRALGVGTNETITILNLKQQDAAAPGTTCTTTTAGSVNVHRNPTIGGTVQNQPAADTVPSQTRAAKVVPAGQTVTVTTAVTAESGIPL